MLTLAVMRATEEYDQDAQKIQEVILAQLNAVAHDDAEQAFSLTSSTSQNSLGNPDNFMQLLRYEFPMIYRHRQVTFDDYDISVNHATQVVHFTDEKNAVWIAVYQMYREKDGKWKVAGCRMLETASVSI